MSTQPSGAFGQSRRPATDEEARAMASGLRLRILRLCLDQALTNKELAQRLGRDPASVLYHVRRLVRTGFLTPEPDRRGARGAREVPYRATGKSWVVEVVDDRGQQTVAVLDAFLDEARRAGLDRMYWYRLGLRLTGPDLAELEARLQALLREYADRRADGEPWSLFVALHPDDRPVGNRPPGEDAAAGGTATAEHPVGNLGAGYAAP